MTSLADQLRIQRQPQSQAPLADQLRELHIMAARAGLWAAADWLWKKAELRGGPARLDEQRG